MDFDYSSNFDNETVSALDYDPIYDKKRKYIITYKNKSTGAMNIIQGEALDKSKAEELFLEIFSNMEIVKTQEYFDWANVIGSELAKDLVKHIKTLEGVIKKKD
jgi:hypothetical protein